MSQDEATRIRVPFEIADPYPNEMEIDPSVMAFVSWLQDLLEDLVA